MLLSIVISAYNIEAYIKKCLTTVLNVFGNLPDVEVLLVTGNSIDQTNAICRTYQKLYKNISVLSQAGRGLSNARNCGIDVARGEYIVFWDGDDYIEAKEAFFLLQILKQHNFDVLISDFKIDVGRSDKLEIRNQIIKDPRVISDYNYISKFLRAPGGVWNIWRYVYRKDFLTRKNLRFLENFKCEDVQFTTAVLLNAQHISFTHTPYYCYRSHREGSLCNTVDSKHISDFLTILNLSYGNIESCPNKEFLKSLKIKLFREYILCTALLCEICGDASHELVVNYKANSIIFKKDFSFWTTIYQIIPISFTKSILSFCKNIKQTYTKVR